MPVPLTAKEPIEFAPPSLAEDKPDVRVIIRVPTLMERDYYGAALVRAGIQYYSQDQIRNFALAGVEDVVAPDERDDALSMLEELYMVRDDENRVERDQMRVLMDLNDKAGKGKTPSAQQVTDAMKDVAPAMSMDRQRRVKAVALAGEIAANYAPLREALAQLSEQDGRRAYMNVRTYVLGWKGLEHEPDPPGSVGLQQHEMDYLREQIGEASWQELSDYITTLQVITEDEEKNSDSLLENTVDPTGSTQSEPSPASSEIGSSTAAPSGRTRAKGSRKTTGSSSVSSTSSRTKTGK